jgi:hypothetical protein
VSETIHGACLCGSVRFAIAPPYRWFSHCHCSMCRKHHGSLFGTALGVGREAFRWLEGAHEIAHYRATAAFERPFCRPAVWPWRGTMSPSRAWSRSLVTHLMSKFGCLLRRPVRLIR